MQVLTTQCPYCQKDVDSTIGHLDGPVVCPNCKKPFEMEMPKAVVASVREVEEKGGAEKRMAMEPKEQILAEVHPVVFRARPIASIVLALVFFVAVVAMVLSLAGMTVAGFAFDESVVIGPASLLTWICAITLLIVAAVAGYWVLLSRFTTLTVTNNRTIYHLGIIARQTSEVQHDDVRNIQLDQSLIQRLLSVGDVGISSSGQDDLEVVAHRLPHPQKIIELIRENQE